jgi:hypothetical protein
MIRLAVIALALATASPAMAQSTLVLPQSGGGYMVIPPQGFSTQVLPLPDGQGWMLVPPPGQQPATVIVPTTPSAPATSAPFSAAQPCCLGLPRSP